MLFPIDPFAFVLVAYRNEAESLARKRYFRMLSEIDLLNGIFRPVYPKHQAWLSIYKTE